MNDQVRINNLFLYATSELSQDAFICWLLSHATEKGWNEDEKIRKCAIEWINCVLGTKGIKWQEDDRILSITRQYKKIDILVRLNRYCIIIEDKTFTNTHNDQINRYKETLIKEGILQTNIFCVYFKIEDQPYPEENVDYEFTREILLQLFQKYKNDIQNPIFQDYLEHIESIEYEVNSYTELPIEQWSERAYEGFFKKYLTETPLLKDRRWSWGKVPNRSGGFMGFWWYDILSFDDLQGMGLDSMTAENIYLQIENDQIAVKYSIEGITNPDNNKIDEIKRNLYDRLHKELGNDFQKKRYARGRHMTVGYITYNETNCIEQVNRMATALLSLKNTKLV